MPDPPQFVEIEGDTCIYCESRIAWYFHTADGLYWVTRADHYPQLPDITVLRTLRTVDRARLDAWTAARAVQQHEAVAQELGCRITQQRFKPPPAGPRQTTTDHVERLTREREQLEKERAEEAELLNKELRADMTGVSAERRRELAYEGKPIRLHDPSKFPWSRPVRYQHRPDYGPPWAQILAEWAPDDLWIEAMFRVYSQQRYRLL